MARSNYITALSLDRYAEIMGINSLHFNGVAEIPLQDGNVLFPLVNAVQDIWPQYSWQNSDQVSRNELGRQIWTAEQEISDLMGMNVAPMWIEDELYEFEQNYRTDEARYSYNEKVGARGVNLYRSHFIAGGRRSYVTLAEPDIQYSDEDGDGFKETVWVFCPYANLSNLPETENFDIRNVKVYYQNYHGDPLYEIRNPVSISDVPGVEFGVEFRTWQMILPRVWESYPTHNKQSISLLDENGDLDFNNIAWSVEVGYEYNDNTKSAADFVYNTPFSPGEGRQDGYLVMADPRSNFVVPVPAAYDTEAEAWTQNEICENDYSRVKLWYYSGYIDPRYRRRVPNDPLSDTLAKAIAYIATARLERIYFTNNNSTALAEHLRDDLSLSTQSSGYHFMTRDVQLCPFGTHVGEVMAWRMLRNSRLPLRMGVATI